MEARSAGAAEFGGIWGSGSVRGGDGMPQGGCELGHCRVVQGRGALASGSCLGSPTVGSLGQLSTAATTLGPSCHSEKQPREGASHQKTAPAASLHRFFPPSLVTHLVGELGRSLGDTGSERGAASREAFPRIPSWYFLIHWVFLTQILIIVSHP